MAITNVTALRRGGPLPLSGVHLGLPISDWKTVCRHSSQIKRSTESYRKSHAAFWTTAQDLILLKFTEFTQAGHEVASQPYLLYGFINVRTVVRHAGKSTL
jgi:hypothetical protein